MGPSSCTNANITYEVEFIPASLHAYSSSTCRTADGPGMCSSPDWQVRQDFDILLLLFLFILERVDQPGALIVVDKFRGGVRLRGLNSHRDAL